MRSNRAKVFFKSQHPPAPFSLSLSLSLSLYEKPAREDLKRPWQLGPAGSPEPGPIHGQSTEDDEVALLRWQGSRFFGDSPVSRCARKLERALGRPKSRGVRAVSPPPPPPSPTPPCSLKDCLLLSTRAGGGLVFVSRC